MQDKELHISPSKVDTSHNSQSFNRTITLEEKFHIRSKSGESGKFSEKSFDKKHSINILAATDGSRSASPKRKKTKTAGTHANTNTFSKFKDSSGVDQIMPSLNIPFKNSVFSNSQLNSFYQRATMMKSFNRGQSLFTAFRDRDDSVAGQSPEKRSASPARDFARKKTVANDESLDMSVDVATLKKRFPQFKPEELTTAVVGEFYLQKQTISDKINALNNKTYTFSPSRCFHRKK